MKSGIRVIGIDDSPFTRRERKVLVIGVVMRERIVEGVLSTLVERDGSDATKKLHEMVARSRFVGQIKAVLLNSIMLAGLNVVDVGRLSSMLKIPVISITRKKPDAGKVAAALKKVGGCRKKLALVMGFQPSLKFRNFYFQFFGCPEKEAREILDRHCTISIPEPLRLAHIIASGVVSGESRGRA